MALRLGGTTIKSWFQYRCERKTRHEMEMGSDVERKHRGPNTSPARWAMLGVEYEKQVIAELKKKMGEHFIQFPSSHDHNPAVRTLSAAMRQFLTEDNGQQTLIAQPNLGFEQSDAAIGGNGTLLIGGSIPDLIWRIPSPDGPPRFQIVDIKATRAATSFHKMQVAFYALLLRSILADLAEEGYEVGSVHPEGEIWHIPEDGSAEGAQARHEAFLLAPYMHAVAEFCRKTAPRIAARTLTPTQDDTFFHIYYKCEQCAYLRSYCMTAIAPTRPPGQRDISAVAGLSQESKRTLVSHGIRTVAQLADCATVIRRMDNAGWILSRRGDTLIERARALRDDEIIQKPDACTFLMPPRVDVAVYLVADLDPVDDMLVTLGYRLVDRSGRPDTIEVLSTSRRDMETAALIRVFGQLQADLAAIDRHNAAIHDPAAPDNLYVHIFIYEMAEATALQNAVRRHLDNAAVRSGLLNMIRLFPPEELIPEPELRGIQHLPACALRNVMEQLFALPVTVSYDLRQVSHALCAKGRIRTEYAPQKRFERPFSSLLSIDIARDLREGRGGAHMKQAVEADVRARLDAMQAITEWLLEENARHMAHGQMPFLQLNKKPFRLQQSFNPFAMGEIDTLQAFELLENRSGLLETLVRLANPAQQRRDARRAIGPMRMIDPDGIRQIAQRDPSATNGRDMVLLKFAVPDMDMTDLTPGTFGLVLSDGAPRHLLDQALWPGLACDLRFAAPGEVTLRMRRSVFCGEDFQEMLNRTDPRQWWLDQVFVDVNSPKSLAFLNFLNAQDTP
ncbi:hypothetical protein KMAL_14210 [Novacetimonas maltaceti]|uniref:PD-(D/E)XK endonuclease-like domain-containing protein n=2 Tax=Novacetimonas maltaceti TaxID=1203393 RepID=A0A2S3W228_9PROT|nr:hypothetical protein KMAL_14210 [Novacetimonas maltaceti]